MHRKDFSAFAYGPEYSGLLTIERLELPALGVSQIGQGPGVGEGVPRKLWPGIGTLSGVRRVGGIVGLLASIPTISDEDWMICRESDSTGRAIRTRS